MEEKFEKVIKEFLEKTKKDCYKVEMIEEQPDILDNKIGGKPYLPLGEEYPCDNNGKPMGLLLQINLKDIDLEDYPKNGILEIFTDIDSEYPCQYSIKYYEEGKDYQTTFPNIDMSRYFVSKSYKLSLSKTVDYMAINDYRFGDVIIPIINKYFESDLKYRGDIDDFFGDYPWYDKIREAFNNNYITIGGYPDFTQQDPRGYKLQNSDECLFKMDSWGSHGNISIGDSGMLFVLISKDDIKNKNFDNAVVDWDCY